MHATHRYRSIFLLLLRNKFSLIFLNVPNQLLTMIFAIRNQRKLYEKWEYLFRLQWKYYENVPRQNNVKHKQRFRRMNDLRFDHAFTCSRKMKEKSLVFNDCFFCACSLMYGNAILKINARIERVLFVLEETNRNYSLLITYNIIFSTNNFWNQIWLFKIICSVCDENSTKMYHGRAISTSTRNASTRMTDHDAKRHIFPRFDSTLSLSILGNEKKTSIHRLIFRSMHFDVLWAVLLCKWLMFASSDMQIQTQSVSLSLSFALSVGFEHGTHSLFVDYACACNILCGYSLRVPAWLIGRLRINSNFFSTYNCLSQRWHDHFLFAVQRNMPKIKITQKSTIPKYFSKTDGNKVKVSTKEIYLKDLKADIAKGISFHNILWIKISCEY